MRSAIIVIGFLVLIGYLVNRYLTYKENKRMKNLTKKLLLLLIIAPLLQSCGMEQIDEGYRGIKQVWGKVDETALIPGFYWYNPISTDVFEMSVREEKIADTTACFTKDTQLVQVAYNVTYYPDPASIAKIYSQFGREWENKIITPAILGSLKDAIGQYIADDLVSQREIVKTAAQNEIITALAERKVTVTRLDITNLDFDDAYEAAVEQKVVAIQKAQEAKNTTVRVKEEATQKIETAKADAEAMRIKANALTQNKNLVGYEAVQKWDGELPKIILGNGSIPMLDLAGVK